MKNKRKICDGGGSCEEETLLQINLCGIMFHYNVRIIGYGVS
jgi:hypothetical protein